MKKVIVISEGKNTGIRVSEQLNSLVGEYIDIENISISELRALDITADLVLFTSSYVKNRSIRYIDSSIPYIVSKRIINHKNIREIISIEEGKDVLFINDGYESAKEAIEQLIELGLDHIKYHPYYPDCTSYPELEIAITAGESQLAPYKPKQLIDIGTRILDVQTIHSIGNILGLEKYLNESLIIDYLNDIVEISKSIEKSRKASQESSRILETVVNDLDYGIAYINNDHEIVDCNQKIEHILGIKKKDIIKKKLEELIPINGMDLNENKSYTSVIENKVILIQFRDIRLYKRIGYIVSIKVKTKSTLKTNYENGMIFNRNLHSFKDYHTINKEALRVIKLAEKFSKTDSTILIEGENGTGKEILAQGIHMNSFRNDNVFVPINMATISSSLLESELFGYEDGTFTGALKGGKTGLFEMADGGTLFIDEIGDAPLEVQAKLLRVLEEKRIRKIGGTDEISVDVRIIAATNKNLFELAKKGKFRLDLFFRLNILPIYTIPLRKRKEDIPYLLKHFINLNLRGDKINNLKEFFQEETIEFLNEYEWIGNVRELINLVEYLLLIYDGKPLGISSLHTYMLDETLKKGRVFLSEDEAWVLDQFYKKDNIPIGRIKITELAKENGLTIGEGRIRKIIKKLETENLIKAIENRGSILTEKGKIIIEEIKSK